MNLKKLLNCSRECDSCQFLQLQKGIGWSISHLNRLSYLPEGCVEEDRLECGILIRPGKLYDWLNNLNCDHVLLHNFHPQYIGDRIALEAAKVLNS
jgi:hypothetical protein